MHDNLQGSALDGREWPKYEDALDKHLKDIGYQTKIESTESLMEQLKANPLIIRITKRLNNTDRQSFLQCIKNFFTPYIYSPEAFISLTEHEAALEEKNKAILQLKEDYLALQRELRKYSLGKKLLFKFVIYVRQYF